jgi:hypothetical protein
MIGNNHNNELEIKRKKEYMSISFCSCVYKIIAKVIALRVKDILSKSISEKVIWFSLRLTYP